MLGQRQQGGAALRAPGSAASAFCPPAVVQVSHKGLAETTAERRKGRGGRSSHAASQIPHSWAAQDPQSRSHHPSRGRP